MSLEEALNQFINNEKTANDIEQGINDGTIIYNINNDFDFANITRELNKLYSYIMNKPVMYPRNSSRKQNLINLLKAIESKTDIEKYYSSNDFNAM